MSSSDELTRKRQSSSGPTQIVSDESRKRRRTEESSISLPSAMLSALVSLSQQSLDDNKSTASVSSSSVSTAFATPTITTPAAPKTAPTIAHATHRSPRRKPAPFSGHSPAATHTGIQVTRHGDSSTDSDESPPSTPHVARGVTAKTAKTAKIAKIAKTAAARSPSRRQSGSSRRSRKSTPKRHVAGRVAMSGLKSPKLRDHKREKLYLHDLNTAVEAERRLFEVNYLPLHNKHQVSKSEWKQLQSIFQHAIHSKKFRRFCKFEWFYSSIDRLYFAQNEFVECLASIGLAGVTKLTRAEWSHVRAMLGKPRRLSRNFLHEERRKLEHFRTEIRAVQQGRKIATDVVPVQEEIPPVLVDGQRVVALHPETQELLTGLVSGQFRVKKVFDASQQLQQVNEYLVAFDTPLQSTMSLGTHWIEDTDLQLVGFSAPVLNLNSHLPPFPNAEGDFHLVSFLAKLIDRKKLLVAHLRNMNEVALQFRMRATYQKMPAAPAPPGFSFASSSSSSASASASTSTSTPALAPAPADQQNSPEVLLPSKYREQYAWVVLQLEQTTDALDDGLARLRSRYDSHTSNDVVGTPIGGKGALGRNHAGTALAIGAVMGASRGRNSRSAQLPAPMFAGQSKANYDFVGGVYAAAESVVNTALHDLLKDQNAATVTAKPTPEVMDLVCSAVFIPLLVVESFTEHHMPVVDADDMLSRLRPSKSAASANIVAYEQVKSKLEDWLRLLRRPTLN
jgi:DIRP